MAVDQAALGEVERFCAARVPPSMHDELRLEVEVFGSAMTIIERRAPWMGDEWSRMPIAQLRQDEAGSWTLFWPRHTGRWQRYDAAPATSVTSLLDEIDADPDGVFWG